MIPTGLVLQWRLDGVGTAISVFKKNQYTGSTVSHSITCPVFAKVPFTVLFIRVGSYVIFLADTQTIAKYQRPSR